LPFYAAIEKTLGAIEANGLGVLTTIDGKATLKKKIDADIAPYTILGACHPGHAHKAMQAEPHIGVMLPCNVIVRGLEDGKTEVSAIDPVASMTAVNNPSLGEVAMTVQAIMKKIIADL
jgi:uncharacterized protein (DUF302 family)